jgi:hypothetical protein
MLLLKVFPSNAHKRITVKLFANAFNIIVTVTHYAVCLWIYVGRMYLLDDDHDPWILADEQFMEYNHF